MSYRLHGPEPGKGASSGIQGVASLLASALFGAWGV